MSEELPEAPRFPDYAEWAGLKRKLGAARYTRQHLDYPLFVRVSDEPRKERAATDAEVAEWKANADAEIEKITERMSEIEAARAAAEDEHEAVQQELNDILNAEGIRRLQDLDEELQRADDAMERAGFTRGAHTPEQVIDTLSARNAAFSAHIIDLQLEPASLAAEVLRNIETITRLEGECDEARAGYHALDKNWETHHEACMRQVRAAIGNADASVGEIVQAIEGAAADVIRLKALLDRDQTGLAAALVAVIGACKGSHWITEGRGCYEWDDERYRQETKWCLERIMGIAKPALNVSGKLVGLAFGQRDQPVQTYAEQSEALAYQDARIAELQKELAQARKAAEAAAR